MNANVKYQFLLFSMLNLCFLSGQNQTQVPRVIPPSPQSALFQKFGELPVNYSNGLVDISIPLYSIKCGNLELPITAKYNGSGVKPDETDLSNIGVGWILNYGGRVSRTVKGQPDEVVAPLLYSLPSDVNEIDQADPHQYETLNSMKDQTSTEYDIFHYSMIGNAGNFIIHNNSAVIEALEPISVTIGPVSSYNLMVFYKGFTINDEYGNQYYYGLQGEREFVYSGQLHPSASSWLLEKIKSADGKDSITFEYEELFDQFKTIRETQQQWSIISINDGGIPLQQIYGYSSRSENTPLQSFQFISPVSSPSDLPRYSVRNIKKITFTSGEINFTLNPSDKRVIQSFNVKDKQGNILKQVTFNNGTKFPYPQFTKLGSIEITGKNGTIEKETYSFQYNETPFPDNYSTDSWGYCNGIKNNQYYRPFIVRPTQIPKPLFPNEIMPDVPYGGENTNPIYSPLYPNKNYIQSYTLKRITYPTKGYTDLNYELNQYNKDNETFDGGGLRISEIRSTSSASSPVVTRKYTYSPGMIDVDPYDDANCMKFQFRVSPINYTYNNINLNFLISTLVYDLNYLFRMRSLSSSWNPEFGSNSVRYSHVTELVENNGKTEYYFNLLPSFSIKPMLQASKGEVLTNYEGYLPVNVISQVFLYGQDQLKKKEVYKQVGQNFQLVESEENQYELYTLKEAIPENSPPSEQGNDKKYSNIVIQKLTYYPSTGPLCYDLGASANDGSYTYWRNIFNKKFCNIDPDINFFLGPYAPFIDNPNIAPPTFSIYQYNITIARSRLTKTIKRNYTTSGAIESTTDYVYENRFHRPISITTTNSDQVVSKQALSYPGQMIGINDPSGIYQAMINKNMIAPIIETTEFKNNVQTGRTKTNYINPYPELYVPGSIQMQIKSTDPVITKAEFKRYDKSGNILELNRNDNVPVSYLWSYNGKYPIAEIVNASYTSVENAAKTVFSVSSAEDLSNLQIPNESKLTDGSLQRALPNAQVTTYTYKILEGMTSKTDPRGLTTYYKYDNFGRLEEVYVYKSGVKNVLQYYDYHYKQ